MKPIDAFFVPTIVLVLRTAALTTFLCFGALRADASVLYDNLFAASNSADPVDSLIFGPLADSFSTGASGSNLTRLQVLLSGGSDTGGVQVSLFADNATSPGSLLASIGTLLDTQLTAKPTVYGFTPSSPIALAVNTRYWLQLSRLNANGTSAMWSWSSDTTGFGVASEFFANVLGVEPNINSVVTGPYQMQLNGPVGATPLPAALPLFACGLGVIGFAAARRKKRKQICKAAG